ncbi:MAG: APC family permease [Candidatus Acidiferrales bacterium]
MIRALIMETTNHGLRRELRLRDLVPMQVALIVWLGWAGFAAKQGSSEIALWLLAIFLFYLPLAAIVMKLSRAMPVEGGAYQWIKEGLSPFAGYMAAWNLTIYVIAAFATIGSFLANGFFYAAGPNDSWMLTSTLFALTLTAIACVIAYVFNVRGLRLAKWWSNAGALLTFATFLALLCVLIKAWATAAPSARSSFSIAWPAFSVLTLAVFAKMAVGALSGFDSSAVFSEECRKPENDVARSVLIAAPLIALMYILGTSAVLSYIAPAKVDVSAALPQVMQAGFGVTGFGRALTVLVAGAFDISFLASMVICVGMVARLPMVAGWDGLLPRWWSTLHPKFRTPSRAIGAVTITLMFLGLLSLLGAGNQEAVQVGASVDVGSLCITYLLLFGVVLFGFRSRGWHPGQGVRLGALSGFAVALISLIFNIVPVGDVASRALFAIKVIASICATNAVGAYLYWRGTRLGRDPATNLRS